MIRLSFIVPCYKVERYVEHCLDSILACGLAEEEYEIICVNDCSPDSTPDILHRYASRYPQIRVIDLAHNVGFGGVRNLAFKAAQGRYIWFVDSDDAVVSAKVVILLEQAEKGNLDVLTFNFDRLGEEHQLLSESRVFPDSEIMEGVPFVKNVMGDMFYQNIGYLWRFLFRKEYLLNNGFSLPEGMCWEDTVFVPQAMIETVRIQSSQNVGYWYYFHQTSVCRVMERQYPGNLIFDYVFRAGADLLNYSRTIEDSGLRLGLANFARQNYLHSNFILYLLRTSQNERKLFYEIVMNNQALVERTRPEVHGLAYVLIYSRFSPFIAELLSFVYKLKRKVASSDKRI